MLRDFVSNETERVDVVMLKYKKSDQGNEHANGPNDEPRTCSPRAEMLNR